MALAACEAGAGVLVDLRAHPRASGRFRHGALVARVDAAPLASEAHVIATDAAVADIVVTQAKLWNEADRSTGVLKVMGPLR